jgi:hypothetical protein
MNAQLNVVYASPDSFDHWHSINWRKCYEKSQENVGAYCQGNTRKVKPAPKKGLVEA